MFGDLFDIVNGKSNFVEGKSWIRMQKPSLKNKLLPKIVQNLKVKGKKMNPKVEINLEKFYQMNISAFVIQRNVRK